MNDCVQLTTVQRRRTVVAQCARSQGISLMRDVDPDRTLWPMGNGGGGPLVVGPTRRRRSGDVRAVRVVLLAALLMLALPVPAHALQLKLTATPLVNLTLTLLGQPTTLPLPLPTAPAPDAGLIGTAG